MGYSTSYSKGCGKQVESLTQRERKEATMLCCCHANFPVMHHLTSVLWTMAGFSGTGALGSVSHLSIGISSGQALHVGISFNTTGSKYG